MTTTALQNLQSKFPQWSANISKLHHLFSLRPISIYIPGPRDADKVSMIRELLSMSPLRVAYVRASETYWSRNLFFEKILVQLEMSISASQSLNPFPNYSNPIIPLPPQKNGYKSTQTCSTGALFIEKLKSFFLPSKRSKGSSETAYILIEDVDKLDPKVLGENILATLLRLEELTSIPIGVIMTGSCDWNDLQPEFAVQPPISIHLRAPSTTEMIQILRQSDIVLTKKVYERVHAINAGEHSAGVLPVDTRLLFNNMVPLIVNALKLAFPTRKELVYISNVLFSRYIEPVMSALEAGNEPPTSIALYARLSPLFPTVINCPSLMMLEEELEKHSSAKSPQTSLVDLPLVCKYLILSAWIASRNPTIDAEFKSRRRRRKTSVSLAARQEQNTFARPQPWRLDKLLSVLDHLLTGNEESEDVDEVQDEELLQRLRKQILGTQDVLKMEESPNETPSQHMDVNPSPNDSETPSQIWAHVEFHEDGVSLNPTPVSSQASAAPPSARMDAAEKDLDQNKMFDSSTFFPLLWEAQAGHTHQLEILTQIGVLEQIGLFIRVSAVTSNTARQRSEYRCGFDSTFAELIADSINFPLWGYL